VIAFADDWAVSCLGKQGDPDNAAARPGSPFLPFLNRVESDATSRAAVERPR
jgi:hypothetical protein